jgi:hypothetical protein
MPAMTSVVMTGRLMNGSLMFMSHLPSAPDPVSAPAPWHHP